MRKFIIIWIFILAFFSCDNGKNTNKSNESKKATTIVKTNPKAKDSLNKQKYPDFLNIDFLMGKFDPSKHKRFVRIEDKYTNKQNVYLDKSAYKSFLKMYEAAYQDGFKLLIVSATRPFDYQKRIWERNWKKREYIKDPVERALDILKFSSMPGTSRHHWGTEIDLNVLENSYYDKGEGKKIFDWMNENAYKFDYYRAYTAGRPYGYQEEKWHWSYKPISKIYTRYAEENMKDEFIKGFSGAETAKKIEITKKYILGINPQCRN